MKGITIALDVVVPLIILTISALIFAYALWNVWLYYAHPCYRIQFDEFRNFEAEVSGLITGSKRVNFTIYSEKILAKFELPFFGERKIKIECEIQPYLTRDVFCVNITRKFFLSEVGRSDLCIRNVRVFNRVGKIEKGYVYQILIEVVDSLKILTIEKKFSYGS